MGYPYFYHFSDSSISDLDLEMLPKDVKWSRWKDPATGIEAVSISEFAHDRPLEESRFSSYWSKQDATLTTFVTYLHEIGSPPSTSIPDMSAGALLSEIAGTTICTLAADDDELDCGSTSKNGHIAICRFRTNDLDIVFQDHSIEITPLFPEDLDDASELTDLEALHDQFPEISINRRVTNPEPLMHRVAASHLHLFRGSEEYPFWLSGFEDLPEPQLISERPAIRRKKLFGIF